MNDIIKLLPDSVANQIAAGEVIQRPASVVKELVENAVDAGATEIHIIIKDAGRTLIQVVDNGRGMTPTDARLAFERHATSKIRNAADLYALHTMGFRGEALPSICAIAQVELRTMPKEASMGTRLLISGSKVELQEPSVCAPGSNFMVKNLFFNTPARRKFLKSDNTELSAIMREFERLALVNHKIRITFTAGNKKLDLRSGTFKQRIADIWRGNLNMQLIPIDVETSMVKMSGFISRPEFARRHNPLQYFIANGRNMKHGLFHKIILQCYQGMIASDTQPCYFLRFEVDPSTIDVNIHPTKSEIKFENQQGIIPILTAAVKAGLGKYSVAPSIDFNEDIMPLDPPRRGDFVAQPKVDIDRSYNPFDNPYLKKSVSVSIGRKRGAASSVSRDWTRLYEGFMSASPDEDQKPVKEERIFADNAESVVTDVTPMCLQLADKYIVTTSREGIMLIDQYRAHVKILYERFMKQADSIDGECYVSQREMFPEVLSLDNIQNTLLENLVSPLQKLGFQFNNLGDGEWRMEAVPAELVGKNPADVITKVLELVSEEAGDADNVADEIHNATIRGLALVTAKASAVQGGQRLSTSEMEHIISDLFSLPDPKFTPEHKLIVYTITKDFIKKQLD